MIHNIYRKSTLSITITTIVVLVLTVFIVSPVLAATTQTATLTPSTTSLFIPSFGTDVSSAVEAPITPGTTPTVISPGPAAYSWDIDPDLTRPCSTAMIENLHVLTTVSGSTNPNADVFLAVGSNGQAVQATTIISGSGYLGAPSVEFILRGENSSPNVPTDGDMEAIYSNGVNDGTITITIGFDSEVYDGQATTPVVDITWNDSSCNQPPATNNDDFTATTGASTTLDPLANDTDTNGDMLIITQIDGQDIVVGQSITLSGGQGTITLNSDGTITFTPADGFIGGIDFSYKVSDGTYESKGLIHITVTEEAEVIVAPSLNPSAPNTGSMPGSNYYPSLLLIGLAFSGLNLLKLAKIEINN